MEWAAHEVSTVPLFVQVLAVLVAMVWARVTVRAFK